jgi:hypothetical protein
MPLLLINFEWWKDSKGYRLVEAEPGRRPQRFTHPVFGHEVEESGLARDWGKPQRVVPRGGKRIPHRPLDKFSDLFKSFSKIKTSEDVLHFIQEFGPLTVDGLSPDHGENVESVVQYAHAFDKWLRSTSVRGRKQLASWIGSEGQKFANLEASLVADSPGVIHLRVTPKSLLGGLWLQLAQNLASGTDIRTCEHCGEWFEVGPQAGRRLDSRFCKDEHRILHNSLKRSAVR